MGDQIISLLKKKGIILNKETRTIYLSMNGESKLICTFEDAQSFSTHRSQGVAGVGGCMWGCLPALPLLGSGIGIGITLENNGSAFGKTMKNNAVIPLVKVFGYTKSLSQGNEKQLLCLKETCR